MLVISARLSNLYDILLPVCNVSPMIITKVGNFTKCAYHWLPNSLKQHVIDVVEAHTKDAVIYTVETENDLALTESELRICLDELAGVYVNRICNRSQDISLPRSAWFETEEDGADKYAHVSVLSVDHLNKEANIRFLSGPLKDDIANVHLRELPIEWLDDLLH